MLVLADWVQRVTGIDPADAVRLTYHDPGSCQRETGFLRDPVGSATRCFEGVAGLKRGNVLEVGDVAVLRRLDDPRWPVGGLWTGASWGCKGSEGTTTLAPRIVAIQAFWNVGYEG